MWRGEGLPNNFWQATKNELPWQRLITFWKFRTFWEAILLLTPQAWKNGKICHYSGKGDTTSSNLKIFLANLSCVKISERPPRNFKLISEFNIQFSFRDPDLIGNKISFSKYHLFKMRMFKLYIIYVDGTYKTSIKEKKERKTKLGHYVIIFWYICKDNLSIDFSLASWSARAINFLSIGVPNGNTIF